MNIKDFVDELGTDFYTGVPDSQLKELCNYLTNIYGIGYKHIIAANEGNAVGIAAGHYLATGNVPVVYMQNSGLGNIVNPVASLLNPKVYAIPCIFVVGWRGEPGVHDEPQHVFQGEISEKLLDTLDISYSIINKQTVKSDIHQDMEEFKKMLSEGRSVAFLVRKGAFEGGCVCDYSNDYVLNREQVVEKLASIAGEDIIVSTTGKISRELFEARERTRQGHERDFLTVGSMGHSSSIAFGIAMSKPDRRVWIIDGDGAALMHMGSMALVGSNSLDNMVHIVIDNEAHETVGGMPTVAGKVDFLGVANACGYKQCFRVTDEIQLNNVLEEIKKSRVLTFVDVKCSIGSRVDLGRPTTSAVDNKNAFMKYIQSR